MLTLVLNVPGRLDLRAPRFDENRVAIGYEGTGYLPIARFYQELTRRLEALEKEAEKARRAEAAKDHEEIGKQ